MVRHNNAIQKNHFRFHWDPCQSQKGHVKVNLGQPKSAQARRVVRQKKALAVFPRPSSGPLRPEGRCETVRYNSKKRMNRGFTTAELKGVGLNADYARTIGIAVDHRRTNKSEEGLNANIQRLKLFLSKLVVFPLKARKAPKKAAAKGKKAPVAKKAVDPKKAAAAKGAAPVKAAITVGKKEERKTATQANLATAVPLASAGAREAPRALSADEKKRHIFQFLRKSFRDTRLTGKREVRAKKKAEKEAEEAAKGAK